MVGQEEVVHVDGALVSPPPVLANHEVVSGRASSVSAVKLSLYHLCTEFLVQVCSAQTNYTTTLSKNLVSLVAALLPAAILLLSLQLR